MCFQKVWKNFSGIKNVPSQELQVIRFPWDLNSGSLASPPPSFCFIFGCLSF